MNFSARSPLTLRHGDRHALAAALGDARSTLLALWRAYEQALCDPGMNVRCLPELNPPLWELGHVAWFEEHWTCRHPLRLRGATAPDAPRGASLLPHADALYNSSEVPHTRRWHLDLPDRRATLRYAQQVRQRSLNLLADLPPTDDALYFHRLCLAHEDMHSEAWFTMAQTLGLSLHDSGLALQPAPTALAEAAAQWDRPAQVHRLGWEGPGFAFDNELTAHDIPLQAHAIDRAPVTWERYLPFIDAGAYDDQALWTPEGWAWRQQHGARPRHLKRSDDDGSWQRAVFGRWTPLDSQQPACHLSLHEAQAWCRWAGRRLPSEAEWEAAALASADGDEAYEWGQVWEWTASAFAPFAGFTPHPYRDYSAPWFDGRPVLRGACFATSPRMKHLRYRNFFEPERNDIFAGFRSCAVD